MRSHAISGFAKPEFEAVREAFIDDFERPNKLGATCCIYFRGENVVDLWGGFRNKSTGEPWRKCTSENRYLSVSGYFLSRHSRTPPPMETTLL